MTEELKQKATECWDKRWNNKLADIGKWEHQKALPYDNYIDGFSDGYLEGLKAKEKENSELKSIDRTSYIKGIRTMANALKDYDRTDGAWTDYFEHTVEKVLKKLLGEIAK